MQGGTRPTDLDEALMIDERPPERCCTHPSTSAPKRECHDRHAPIRARRLRRRIHRCASIAVHVGVRARVCVLCCVGECVCACACLGVHARHRAVPFCSASRAPSDSAACSAPSLSRYLCSPKHQDALHRLAAPSAVGLPSANLARACVRGHMHACVIGCVRVHACVRKHSRLCACLWVLMSVHACLCVCSCVQSRPAPLVELGVPLEVAHVQCARLGFEPAAGDRATGGE